MVDYLIDLIDTDSFDCERNFAGCFNEGLYKENCKECLKRAVGNHDNIIKTKERAKTIEEFVVRLKQSLIYTSDEEGWEGYTVEEKEIYEIAEKMKGVGKNE